MHKETDTIKQDTPEDKLAHNIGDMLMVQPRFEFSSKKLIAAVVHETIAQLMVYGVIAVSPMQTEQHAKERGANKHKPAPTKESTNSKSIA